MNPKNTLAGQENGRNRRRRAIIVIISVVLVLAIAGGGLYYYRTYVAPFRRVVLTVDNQVIRMDYFLKRVRLADNDSAATLQQLTYEQIVKLMAPQYGFDVSSSDVETQLRKEAAGTGGAEVTEAQFQEWYRGTLKKNGLSDSEFRELIKTDLLAAKFENYLASQLPARTEQVHLNAIMLATSADAARVKARINAGEDFAALARELSLDSQAKSNGGDLGWIPRGVTPYDDTIFQLAAGQVSDPVAVDPNSPEGQYLLFLVSARESDRLIDDGPMQVLRSRALYTFILQQIPRHVKYSYSPEDQAWVAEQLAKTPNP